MHLNTSELCRLSSLCVAIVMEELKFNMLGELGPLHDMGAGIVHAACVSAETSRVTPQNAAGQA